MHDCEPSWDYPIVALSALPELEAWERALFEQLAARAATELAPAMGFSEGIEVHYCEYAGLGRDNVVAVYCNGTSSRPVIVIDPQVLKEQCAEHELGLAQQFMLTLAHELGHAFQETLGIEDEEHDDDLEEAAEAFGREWADRGAVNLALLLPADGVVHAQPPQRPAGA